MKDRSQSIKKLIASHVAKTKVTLLEATKTEEILGDQPSDFADTMAHDMITKVHAAWDYEHLEADENRRRALEKLSQKAHAALDRLHKTPAEPLSIVDYTAMESVIVSNGTRPSLLIQHNKVLELGKHPMAGDYADDIERHADHIAKICQATGRIQPGKRGGAANFLGTGVLINTKGAVLTNLHVADKILRRTTTIKEEKNGVWRIYAGVTIDFVGETQSREQALFPVKEIRPIDLVCKDLNDLDIAIMQLGDPEKETSLPEPLPVRSDIDAESGSLGTICIVGFPGHPAEGKTAEDIQLEKVIETIFGNRFGLKRFAPGMVTLPIGYVEDDPVPWVFGHDVSTLGGNSGSPCCNFIGDAYAFGVHFMGLRQDKQHSNLAHALSPVRVQNVLKELGVFEN